MVAACASYEPHQRRLTVAPDPVPCADGTPGSCMKVTDAEGDIWITSQDQIEGFTYQPGSRYELLVEEASEHAEVEAATPPRLRLVQIVSREAAGDSGPALDIDLGGTRWVLTGIEPSDQPGAAWAASGITAEFDPAAKRLSGSAGCNTYSAALVVSGEDMQVSEPAATRKACPPPAMALEQEYLERIARASAFAIRGDRLDLSLADGSGMAFRAASP